MGTCEWFMMKLCEAKGRCGAWAQWHVVYPDKTRRRFCQRHKEEHEQQKGDIEVKYVFVGAESNGIDDTKS